MTYVNNRQSTRKMGAAIVILVLLATLAVPTTTRGVTTEEKADLFAVTKEIILRTAKVGLDEAGTRLLGLTAWRFLKQAATPVFDRLKQKYPDLFLGESKGTPKIQQQARDAARTFQENRELQSMLITGFSNLEKGQQEILTEIRLLKVNLENMNSAIDEMSKLNRESFDKILYELELIRNQRKLTTESAVVSTSEWPLIFDEIFADNSSGWWNGDFPAEGTPRFDIRLVSGKYRWDAAYTKNLQRFILAPTGTVVNFSLGVDVKVINYTPEAAFSLIFCATEYQRYAFTVSTNGMYNVSTISGADFAKKLIVGWSSFSTDFDPKKWNRLDVVVNNQIMRFYVNSKLVGEYREVNLSGGKVGLGLDIFQKGFAVVDFDNFQLRRRP